jgi:hypothetical protein
MYIVLATSNKNGYEKPHPLISLRKINNMKTQLITFSLVIAAALTGCNGDTANTSETSVDSTVTAPPADNAQTETPKLDSAAQAKAWMDYMTPGDMHKWMASTDGNWSGTVKSWMAPDAPPDSNAATMTAKTVMGGRYQQSTFKSTMMGMPFEGMGTMAFDNAKKEFVTTWVDNMGTGVMVMNGKMDDATKTINFEGNMTDPATGKDSKMREVVRFPDANTQVMEMYCTTDGKEMKMMEMTLTRK